MRQNPHVRICGGPGSATTLVYPTSFDGDAGPDPRLGDVARVAEGLLRIVEVEGPMLVKRSYDIYLRGCGIRKMGGPLRRAMNQALRYAVRTGDVVTEDESGTGDLLDAIARLRTAPPVLVRNRGPRDFREIPPSELQLVARQLSDPEGLEPGSDAHLRSVLDFFDIKRLTVQVGTTLLEVLDRRYSYVDEVLGQRTTVDRRPRLSESIFDSMAMAHSITALMGRVDQGRCWVLPPSTVATQPLSRSNQTA